ncbi:hypothetical protein AB0M54_46070 [Actinoplanes sp. NPDC051470]|uniref:hypothetical protein n=1 Tax=unclassified Actinoplanes TaxID=2626549 RepID=UPI00341DBF30
MTDRSAGPILGASSFNWTPDVLRADRAAHQIVTGICADGVCAVIELEAGQVWRSFPAPADEEVDALREELTAANGRVSIVGASIDEFALPLRRRTPAERLAFLVPQLLAARRVGALGIRLPIGQAGRPLLERLQPVLHELNLTLFEELQGPQSPADPATAQALETISDLADPRIRALVDISMLMPALPVSYLERLRRGGVPAELVARLTREWLAPETPDAVIGLLQSGGVPPRIHPLYLNLLIRFGRSGAEELRDVLDLVGGFHLKFWDLDDDGGRVTGPIRDLGRLLAGTGFSGTLTSEWGGHEWLHDQDATTTTRRHLALARAALIEGGLAA